MFLLLFQINNFSFLIMVTSLLKFC